MNELFNDLQFTPEAQAYLREIEKNLKSDLAAPSQLYFSHETFELVSRTGLEKLKARLGQMPSTIDLAALRDAWRETVLDYHASNHWGFPAQSSKPAKILTEDDKIRKEMWPYIWVVIQSMIILKTVVYYFGMQSSLDPSPLNKVLVGLALGTSAFTLIFFAWRKSRK